MGTEAVLARSGLAGYALSPQQKHVWELMQGESHYVAQIRVDIEGEIDIRRLKESFRLVTLRHETLRSRFDRLPGVHAPVQVILPEGDVLFEETDLRAASEAVQCEGAEHAAAYMRDRLGNISNGCPLRVQFLRCSEDRAILLVGLPALCADAGTLTRVVEEAALLSAGIEPDEPVSHMQFSAWQNELLEDSVASGGQRSWDSVRQAVSSSSLTLPLEDASGADVGAPHTREYHLDGALTRSVQRLAEESRSTVEQVLLAAWMALLFRLTGTSDLVVSALFDPRLDAGSELDRMLGPCSRYLPLMVHLNSERAFRDLLTDIGYAFTDAREGADAFSWDLFGQSGKTGASVFLPLAFDYAAPFEPIAANGTLFRTVSLDACHDHFRLRLSCAYTPTGSLLLRFHYAPHRFTGRSLDYVADAFETLLANAMEDPGRALARLDVLGPVQLRELLTEFNDTSDTAPFVAVHRRFEEAAQRFPGRAAILCGDVSVTFADLEARANRLAYWLRLNGVRPESLVAICLGPSPELIVSLLGVLKAGGAYVPVNPAYPTERIRFMTSGLLTLASAATASALPDGTRAAFPETILSAGVEPESCVYADPDPRNLAYVLYTSGSTGEPKGVLVTHGGLSNYLAWSLDYYPFGCGGNGAPLHSSIAFDLTVTSVFAPLLAGEPVHIAPAAAGPEALTSLMRSGPDFTFVKLTPSHLRLLNQQLTPNQAPKSARALILGGEALSSEHVAFWASAGPGVVLFNEYGPTETVVGCCCYQTPAGSVREGAIPIGRPIRNTHLYILDPDLNPVAPGLPGELYIGGMGVARGYLDRPGLTADRFVPDALSGKPGARLYRTGDLVRFRADLNLEYLGRIDDQIKVRGFRIEPREIEATLVAYAGVRDALVLADEPQPGERRLIAYFVNSGTEAVAIPELRRFLEARLPDYMVPAIYMQLPALPLTANGKVDRRNLPAPGQARPELENTFVMPLTVEEEVLAGVWSQVLHIQGVGISDNYFALGGDSIRSIQIVARAQERGLHFSVDDLFKHPTIQGLASVLRTQDSGPFMSGDAFSMISAADRERIPARVEDAYPLTQLQAGMIFHREYRPGSAIYHDISSFYVRAPFDSAKLQTALAAMGARHAALRTSFDMAGFSQPLQLVHSDCDFSFRLVDISTWTQPDQEAEIDRFYEREKAQGFDFARPPLLRMWIHMRGPSEWQFTLSFHHAILDGWSEATLITEMFHQYLAMVRDEAAEVHAPVSRFRDYVALELAALASEEAGDYWTGKLRDAIALELPRWRLPAAGSRARREILVHEAPLSREVSDGLKRLALSAAVPVKDVLLAAHMRVMALLCGNTDVLTCVVSAGRPETLDGERVAGLFINSIPFRAHLGGGTWSDLVTEIFDAEREALPYRRFPMAEIRRRLGGQSLSETLFYFTHYHVYQSVQRVPNVELLGARLYEETSFTLAANFRLDPFNGDVAFILKCDGNVLAIEQVRAIAECYSRCLEAMALSPLGRYETSPLLGEKESLAIRKASYGPERDYPNPIWIHEWIERQVEVSGEREAIRAEGVSVSYRELEELANQVAHGLRRRGVGPEVCVGVCLERGVEMVVALLGVLKAGGAYVPMEPGYPAERLGWIAQDAGLKLVLSQRRWAERLPEGVEPLWLDEWEAVQQEPRTRVPTRLEADNLAYVIHTSGSTGRPKGAMNTQGGLRNRLLWMQEYLGLESGDVVLQKTPFSFDVSVWEFFWPLMEGARLVMARPGGHQDSGYLAETIEREQVSTMHFVPSMLEVFLEEEQLGGCGSLRRVICSGEGLSRALQERFEQRLGCGLYNLYGPTEASVDVTAWACERGSVETVVPIGHPIANTQVHVLDEYGGPAPVGVAGQVYLGGAGLGRGYLGRADWTADRWVPDALSGVAGARLYRTGDVGRRRTDGAVEYLGRADQQVKLRGFRIELGEIEAALRNCTGVREAVVMARSDHGDQRLAAYVVSDADIAPAALRLQLQSRLPDYMVPSSILRIDRLPLSPNGKLDRKALPAPHDEARIELLHVAPRNDTESTVARIWAEVLGRERVGINDNFFELGGHSLSATLATARIRAALETNLPLRALYESPTVAGLSAWLDAQASGNRTYEALPVIIPDPANSHAAFPLAAIQQAYWVGRRRGFELGGTSAHLYVEFEAREVDVARLEQSVRLLVRRHDMLRAVVDADGLQHILPEVPEYEIAVLDLAAVVPAEAELRVEQIRAEMSHYVFDPGVWPLFDIRVEHLPGGTARLHVGVDVLILDAGSLGILTRELTRLYHDPGAELSPLDIGFRDYVLAEEQLKSSALYDRSRDFWLRRIEDLPPSPELPLLRREASAATKFTRYGATLAAADWQRLKKRAAASGLTPTGLLLAAFARVLACWSKSSRFTLNLTTFNRLPMHPQVSLLVGDFTSLTLVPVDWTGQSFEDNALALQSSLVEGLDHPYFHGVEVLRELARRRGDRLGASMPVVLTSTLALQPGNAKFDTPFPVELVSGITQTPQTYLDNQLSERDGALVVNWDVIEGLFPAGLMEEMFGAYTGLLERLAREEGAWSDRGERWLRPAGQRELCGRSNATAAPQASGLLQDGFFEQARSTPENAAVLTAAARVTYGELAASATYYAEQLRQLGAGPNQLVAVVMEKGWEQVAAVLAVVEAGAAYLPIDASLPEERRGLLLALGETRVALTQPRWSRELAWPEEIQVIAIEAREAGQWKRLEARATAADLAYVIFTSGSTGVPKGVMMEHGATLNTLADVNRRFQVGPGDRLLGLSSLSFDLSVYDIFGVLGAGGALVLAEAGAERDPGAWLQVARQHGVTLWNSVPALLEMAVEYAEGRGEELPGSLRAGLLSGDWIPVTLPGRVRALAPGMQLASLGGATEAAIWSIHYAIGEVAAEARSIPYGRPLDNQRFYVLDAYGEERPVWVTGQLHIGGAGLARGYWHDPERTAEQFWIHPRTGERLYRTGDLGRWLPDGNIEFLGREDAQVKLQGHRIELGEIEAALRRHPAVKDAAVTLLGSASSKRLAAYLVLDKDATTESPATSNVLLDASARERLKHQALQLRSRDAASALVPLTSLPLEAVEAFVERRSHRAFRPEPLPFENFSRFLGQLREIRVNGEAKYQYASAGGVYPVQIYLCVKPGRVASLAAGVYYYHPVDHELHALSSGEIPENVHWPSNREAFRNSAFSLFLVAEKATIEPLYGSKARDFCLIEAGILMQVLEAAAPACGVGNCQIGSVDFDRVRELLHLGPSQEIVHSSVAGYAQVAAAAPLIQAPVAGTQGARAPTSLDAFRRHLECLLPHYMVPSAFAVLDTLPLGANGKVDRKALPPIDEPSATPRRIESAAIDDVLESKIAAAMALELNGIEVGRNENFFDLGATSLTLVRFTNRLLKQHGIEAPIVDVFRHSTVAGLAQRLAMALPEVPSSEAERARAAKGHHARSRLARAREAAASE